jgi:hypothetical protein
MNNEKREARRPGSVFLSVVMINGGQADTAFRILTLSVGPSFRSHRLRTYYFVRGSGGRNERKSRDVSTPPIT